MNLIKNNFLKHPSPSFCCLFRRYLSKRFSPNPKKICIKTKILIRILDIIIKSDGFFACTILYVMFNRG